jgi:hypothetical protein
MGWHGRPEDNLWRETAHNRSKLTAKKEEKEATPSAPPTPGPPSKVSPKPRVWPSTHAPVTPVEAIGITLSSLLEKGDSMTGNDIIPLSSI